LIIENTGLKGLTSDLAYLDEMTTKLGFVRWQWEYTRATYDFKIEDKTDQEDYFLRFNARAIEGKLESPYAVLVLGEAYIGRATFPHGLDYESPIPEAVLKISRRKLSELQSMLSHAEGVKEIMTKDCVTVKAEASLHDAALLMREHNIGFLPVVGEGRELAGVITDRDLVIRGYADHQSESVTVGEIVSRNITAIPPHTTVEEAARIMAREQIRRLPVVDKGRLLGVVALGDIAIRKVLAHEAGETLGRISLPTEA